jgi:hypothetical protein
MKEQKTLASHGGNNAQDSPISTSVLMAVLGVIMVILSFFSALCVIAAVAQFQDEVPITREQIAYDNDAAIELSRRPNYTAECWIGNPNYTTAECGWNFLAALLYLCLAVMGMLLVFKAFLNTVSIWKGIKINRAQLSLEDRGIVNGRNLNYWTIGGKRTKSPIYLYNWFDFHWDRISATWKPGGAWFWFKQLWHQFALDMTIQGGLRTFEIAQQDGNLLVIHLFILTAHINLFLWVYRNRQQKKMEGFAIVTNCFCDSMYIICRVFYGGFALLSFKANSFANFVAFFLPMMFSMREIMGAFWVMASRRTSATTTRMGDSWRNAVYAGMHLVVSSVLIAYVVFVLQRKVDCTSAKVYKDSGYFPPGMTCKTGQDNFNLLNYGRPLDLSTDEFPGLKMTRTYEDDVFDESPVTNVGLTRLPCNCLLLVIDPNTKGCGGVGPDENKFVEVVRSGYLNNLKFLLFSNRADLYCMLTGVQWDAIGKLRKLQGLWFRYIDQANLFNRNYNERFRMIGHELSEFGDEPGRDVTKLCNLMETKFTCKYRSNHFGGPISRRNNTKLNEDWMAGNIATDQERLMFQCKPCDPLVNQNIPVLRPNLQYLEELKVFEVSGPSRGPQLITDEVLGTSVSGSRGWKKLRVFKMPHVRNFERLDKWWLLPRLKTVELWESWYACDKMVEKVVQCADCGSDSGSDCLADCGCEAEKCREFWKQKGEILNCPRECSPQLEGWQGTGSSISRIAKSVNAEFNKIVHGMASDEGKRRGITSCNALERTCTPNPPNINSSKVYNDSHAVCKDCIGIVSCNVPVCMKDGVSDCAPCPGCKYWHNWVQASCKCPMAFAIGPFVGAIEEGKAPLVHEGAVDPWYDFAKMPQCTKCPIKGSGDDWFCDKEAKCDYCPNPADADPTNTKTLTYPGGSSKDPIDQQLISAVDQQCNYCVYGANSGVFLKWQSILDKKETPETQCSSLDDCKDMLYDFQVADSNNDGALDSAEFEIFLGQSGFKTEGRVHEDKARFVTAASLTKSARQGVFNCFIRRNAKKWIWKDAGTKLALDLRDFLLLMAGSTCEKCTSAGLYRDWNTCDKSQHGNKCNKLGEKCAIKSNNQMCAVVGFPDLDLLYNDFVRGSNTIMGYNQRRQRIEQWHQRQEQVDEHCVKAESLGVWYATQAKNKCRKQVKGLDHLGKDTDFWILDAEGKPAKILIDHKCSTSCQFTDMYWFNLLAHGDTDEDGRLNLAEFNGACGAWGLPIAGCTSFFNCALGKDTAIKNGYLGVGGANDFAVGDPRLACGGYDTVTQEHYLHHSSGAMVNQLFFADTSLTTCCGCGASIKSKWCINDKWSYKYGGKIHKTYPWDDQVRNQITHVGSLDGVDVKSLGSAPHHTTKFN